MTSLVILILVLLYFGRRKGHVTVVSTPQTAQQHNDRECDDLEDEIHDIEGSL